MTVVRLGGALCAFDGGPNLSLDELWAPFLDGPEGEACDFTFAFEATAALPAGPLPAPGDERELQSVRTADGLWFRRFGSLCWARPDLAAWKVLGRPRAEATPLRIDGRPWLLLAFWGVLAARGGAFLHGAACYLHGRHFVALGPSGAGKSTLASLVVGQGGTCLTDEYPFVTGVPGGVLVHGTPWRGARGPSAPLDGPLAAVLFLRHAAANELRRLDPPEAGRRLVGNARLFRWKEETVPLTLDLLDRIARTVPVYELGFRPDPSAIDTLEAALCA